MNSPTLKDVYDVVNRLEDKVDKQISSIKTELNDRISAVEIRTDGLESFRDEWGGRLSVLVIIATTVVSLITAFLKDFFFKTR